MPDHKNQHYVPRCHLRPFSLKSEGKAINLFHIKSGALIEGAPLKSQCAKEYFYGEDLKLETWLQDIEGKYSTCVRAIIEDEKVESGAEEFIRDFCYLQYLRTDIAVRRTLLAQTEMADLIFEGAAEHQRPADLTRKELVELLISNFLESVSCIRDLKVCIFRNETRLPFVTSDDPAILVNRFYTQRLGARWRASGIANAGAMLALPISPMYLVFSYDGDVYVCDERARSFVALSNERDVQALNELQFIKASESVYFSPWSDGGRVKQEFDLVSARRPAKWHDLHYAVRDDAQSDDGSTRFRVVHKPAERLEAGEALIHLELKNLEPTMWCSKIKFRAKPIFVDTKSGAGYLRRTQRD